jgi:hypothetical protein
LRPIYSASIANDPKASNSTLQLALIIVQALFVSTIFALLYLHWTTVATYVLLALAVGVVAGISVAKSIGSKWIFVHSFVLFVAVRLVYFFATDFKSIPFGDSYWDLAVVKTFLSSNQVSIIEEPLYPPRLMTWYSSWPLLHTLEATLVQATGISVESIHMFFAAFISGLTFVFSFLFLRIVSRVLGLESKYLYLAVVLFAVSPEAIFWGLAPTRQELASFLLTMSIFLIAKSLEERKRSYILMTFFCVGALVFTHHFTSAIATGLFAGAAVLYPPRQLRGTYSVLSLILGISILLWWTGYADIIFETPAFSDLNLDSLNFSLASLRPAAYPDLLSPQWLLVLLRARDVILYAAPIVGAAFLVAKRSHPYARFVLMLSAAAAAMLVLNLSIQSLEPTRVLMMFMPILALFTAVAYSELAKRGRISVRLNLPILGGLVAFVVCISFIGLWGHDFAPLHLYDNSISGTSVGEHSPTVTDVKQFLNQNVNYSQVDNFVSEFHSSLVQDLPPSQYGKIVELQNTVPVRDSKTVVVSTDNLNVYKYFAGFFAGIQPQDREALKSKLQERLSAFNLEYSDGSNKVWR